jgi:light-regulated signal transduction histidine kinase (bacteriophytochrome)
LSQRNGTHFAEVKHCVTRLEAEIQERKHTQEQMERRNRQLEERVRQSTAELAVANHELEAFTYSVAHDLRAPLRAVGGFARMMVEHHAGMLPADGHHQLERIRANAAKMGQLIDGLLDLSRCSRQALHKNEVSVTDIVQQVLGRLQAQQAGRHVEVCVKDLATCQADPTLLEKAYANLLSNALKFTRNRDPARIEVGWQEDLGRRVYFVKDNGAGFEMEYAGRLFGVFQRLHRAEQFEGAGVGLAITHRIIRRHGGQIWAEGAPEKGATFYFTLDRGEWHG